MNQKTEASQAVAGKALTEDQMMRLSACIATGEAFNIVSKADADAIRASLKAQSAPTEAQGEPNKQVFENIEELRSAATAVVARWDSPKWKDEAPTADFIARLRKALQPSGNTGEFDLRQTQDGKVVQGWDVDDLISNMGIEKEVAKARSELQADPAIIPSLLAVQGEDSARLDMIYVECMCKACNPSMLGRMMFICPSCGDKNCPHASNHESACARASAETGGVKP